MPDVAWHQYPGTTIDRPMDRITALLIAITEDFEIIAGVDQMHDGMRFR